MADWLHAGPTEVSLNFPYGFRGTGDEAHTLLHRQGPPGCTADAYCEAPARSQEQGKTRALPRGTQRKARPRTHCPGMGQEGRPAHAGRRAQLPARFPRSVRAQPRTRHRRKPQARAGRSTGFLSVAPRCLPFPSALQPPSSNPNPNPALLPSTHFVASSMFFLEWRSLGSVCCLFRYSDTALAGNSVSQMYPKSRAK